VIFYHYFKFRVSRKQIFSVQEIATEPDHKTEHSRTDKPSDSFHADSNQVSNTCFAERRETP